MSISRRAFLPFLGASFAMPSRAFGQDQMAAAVPTGTRPPNIVIFLADDLGYGDLGCYGNQTIRTPHIDNLARDGVRLTEFYATPTCTPSRAALLTGRYPLRSGLTRVLIPKEHFGIADSEITLAEALKTRGYRTGCIGKWHLGNRPLYRPNRHGFDHFYGLLYSNDMSLPVVNWPPIQLFLNESVVESPVRQRTLTQRFTAEALWFMKTYREQPFLLYLSYTMPHLPVSSSEMFAGTSEHGKYGDAVQELDWSVGEVMSGLSRYRLDKNTIVIFLSDNGPELKVQKPGGATGELRGGKGSTWEGGVRVPAIVRWPDRIPAGTVRAGITCLMDVFSTCVKAAGAELPESCVIDGDNLLPFLQGRAESPRDTYIYYFRHHLCAVRSGEWKLHIRKRSTGPKGAYGQVVACEPLELYNLRVDPSESRNVHSDFPDVAARLNTIAAEHQDAIEGGRRAPPYWRSILPGKRKGGKIEKL